MLHLIKEIVKQFPPIRRVLDQRHSLSIERDQLLDQVRTLASHNAELEARLRIEHDQLLDQIRTLTSHSANLEASLDELKEQVFKVSAHYAR